MGSSAPKIARDVIVGVISGTVVSGLTWVGSQSLTWLPKSIEIPVWLAAIPLVLTGLVFWLLGVWAGSIRQPPQPPTPAPPTVDTKPTRSDDQIAVIKALRLHDDEYQPIEILQRTLAGMGRPMPKSDVRVILRGLGQERWAESKINTDTYDNWYRLTGRGVEFAREHGFPVLDQ